MTDYQESLIKFSATSSTRKNIALSLLPSNSVLISKPVSKELIADMSLRGQMDPILVAETERGLFVVAGNRRIKAARVLSWDQIDAIVTKMPYREAMLARAADNNLRISNDIADVASIQMLLEEIPQITLKEVSRLTGINQGRIKSLIKMARLPKMFTEGVMQGTISEETLKKLSTMGTAYVTMATQKYLAEESKWKKKENGNQVVWERDGKEYKTPPSFLTGDDIKKIQQERVQQTVSTQLEIPEMSESMLTPDSSTMFFAIYSIEKSAIFAISEDKDVVIRYAMTNNLKDGYTIVRISRELNL